MNAKLPPVLPDHRENRAGALEPGEVRRIVRKLLASADAVLAATGERVRACPRYGVPPRKAA